MEQSIISKIKSFFLPIVDFTTSGSNKSLGQLQHMSYSSASLAPQQAYKPAKPVDPLEPLQTFEGGEVFRLRKYSDLVAYLWLNFKENEDWREYDDETLLIKSEAMAMIRLKFTKDKTAPPERC